MLAMLKHSNLIYLRTPLLIKGLAIDLGPWPKPDCLAAAPSSCVSYTSSESPWFGVLFLVNPIVFIIL